VEPDDQEGAEEEDEDKDSEATEHGIHEALLEELEGLGDSGH